MKKFLPGLAALALVFTFDAEPAGKFALTIDNIMRGPGLYGYEPSAVRWSGGTERIYFQWKQASDPIRQDPDTYVVNRDASGLRKLSDEEAKLAPPASGSLSLDKKREVYVRSGDIFLYDLASGKTSRITQTAAAKSNPHFTRDGRRIAFAEQNNLYAIALDTGSIEQLTDIETGSGEKPADEKKGTDSQEYLKAQAKELSAVVREQAEKRASDEAKKKTEQPRKPFRLDAKQTVRSLTLTPDEKYVVAVIQQPGTGAKNTVIPNFMTESEYTEEISSRDKVGDVQAQVKLALVSVESGDVTWVDPGQKDRDITLSTPEWSEDGTQAVMLGRAADNKDRWILALDEATGKTRIVAHDHDDAWLDGPGATTLGWMRDG